MGVEAHAGNAVAAAAAAALTSSADEIGTRERRLPSLGLITSRSVGPAVENRPLMKFRALVYFADVRGGAAVNSGSVCG
jgi:hypothetical protein